MQAGKRLTGKMFFKIGEVSEIAGLEPYVLRYWESEFDELKPNKGSSNQRLYKKSDVELILRIKKLLYEEGYTINGARKLLKQRGSKKKGKVDYNEYQYQRTLKTIRTELEKIRRMLKT